MSLPADPSHPGRWVAIGAMLLAAACALWLGRGDNRHSGVPIDLTPAATHPAFTQPGDFRPPVARSANERVAERRRMVDEQIANPDDGRQRVSDKSVIEAMLAVPRHAFVSEELQRVAYADGPLPIGHEQTISQPYIVALMTEHLKLTPASKVLEIGTGSGYQAAVLAHLTPHVFTIEIVEDLARAAARTLKDQGYTRVRVRAGDGYAGWPEHAPFDAIIVTCAPEQLPRPLWDQLKPGGRIVIPIGPAHEIQRLVVISKTPDAQRRTQTITEVRFVPMTGRSRE